jgi:hypothetical protein
MSDLTPGYGARTGLLHPQEGDIAGLLDDAHRTLPATELAEVLLGVGRAAAPLSVGEPPRETRQAGVDSSPEVRGYLGRLVDVLCACAATEREGMSAPDRVRLGRWLRDELDDVAARPRGAAVPAAAL